MFLAAVALLALQEGPARAQSARLATHQDYIEEIGRSGDLAKAPEALAALDAEIPKLEEAIAAWSRGAAA